MAVLACAAIGAGLVFQATPDGLGLFGDSVDYVFSARSVAAGRGAMTLGNGGPVPLTQFPPGYAWVCGGLAWATGADAVDVARWLNAAALAVAVIALAAVAHVCSGRRRGAAVAAGAMLATSPFVLLNASRLYADTLFLAFAAVAVLGMSVHPGGRRRVMLAGCAAGAGVAGAFAVKYLGVVLLVPLAAWAASLLRPARRSRSSVAAAMIAAALVAVPAGALLWRWATVGQAHSREFSLRAIPADKLWQGLETLGSWVVALDGVAGRLAGGAVLAALSAVCGWAVSRAWRRREFAAAALPVTLLCVGVGIVAFTATLDANIPFNHRILLPVQSLGLTLLAVTGARLAAGRRGLVVVATAVAVAVVAAQGWRTARWSQAVARTGQGYTGPMWRDSPVLRAVADLPPDVPIYSNAYDAIYLRTGRVVKVLPKYWVRSANRPDETYRNQVNAMALDLRERDGRVVIVDAVDRSDFIAPVDKLNEFVRLVPARRKQPRDGAVYRLAGD